MIIDQLLIFSASLVYLFKLYLWQLKAKITFSPPNQIKIVNIYANYKKKEQEDCYIWSEIKEGRSESADS